MTRRTRSAADPASPCHRPYSPPASAAIPGNSKYNKPATPAPHPAAPMTHRHPSSPSGASGISQRMRKIVAGGADSDGDRGRRQAGQRSAIAGSNSLQIGDHQPPVARRARSRGCRRRWCANECRAGRAGRRGTASSSNAAESAVLRPRRSANGQTNGGPMIAPA